MCLPLRCRTLTGALTAALLALAVATPAHGAPRDRSCGWILEPTADRENILFPEITTRYLAAIVPVPPGGSVEITGRFPHARYMSLRTDTRTLQSVSVLRDEQIVPDAGSSNPYLPGADRIPLPQCGDPLPDTGLTQALAGLGAAELDLPPTGLSRGGSRSGAGTSTRRRATPTSSPTRTSSAGWNRRWRR